MLYVYFLLDRSGSMSNLWDEAIGSINGYVSKLEQDSKVHVVAFDSVSYDVLRDERVEFFKPIDPSEALPRGSTPLYDSCAKLLDLAEQEAGDKAIILIMTDGYENASHEYSQSAIKARLKRWTDSGKEVLYLGANFDDISSISGGFGAASGKSIIMGAGKMRAAMDYLAQNTVAYATASTAINLVDSAEKL